MAGHLARLFGDRLHFGLVEEQATESHVAPNENVERLIREIGAFSFRLPNGAAGSEAPGCQKTWPRANRGNSFGIPRILTRNRISAPRSAPCC